jgi:protein required for attachment to host cells
MSKLDIPHDAFIFVGDGRKALFLRNTGDERFPNLKTERVFVDKNPPTHEQGADRPGRAFKRAGTNLRSGVAPPRALADLRNAFHADVKGRIIAEIDKDLTNHSVYEIEKHLVG